MTQKQQLTAFHFGHLALVALCVVFLFGIIFLKNGFHWSPPDQNFSERQPATQTAAIEDSDAAQIYGDIQTIIDKSGQDPHSAPKPQVAGAHTETMTPQELRGAVNQ